MAKSTIGYQLNHIVDLRQELDAIEAIECTFLLTKLFPPDDVHADPVPDVALKSALWSTAIIGMIDCSDLSITLAATSDVVRRQMNYMNYTQVYGICMDCPPTRSGVKHMAALINNSLAQNLSHTKIFIQIKADLKTAERMETDNTSSSSSDWYTDSWHQWNELRSLLQPSRKIFVALEVGGDLPNDDEQNRWGGEPVRLLMLPTSSFLANKQGFPVLPVAFQRFISLLMDRTANVLSFVIQGLPSVMTIKEHSLYLQHLTKEVKDDVPRVVRNTEDYIQHPLQPLRDNLDGATYEIFEKDPVKYETYRKAILHAINDKKDQKASQEIVILVVGAGRGPLVTSSVYGAEDAHVAVTIYVVEKNVNAIPSLRYSKQTLWDKSKNVKTFIFHTDMRNFVAEKKADIVVSELLGSFSDNELSPECLDGIYRSVHPDAISIPQEYTSHLCPIMSTKLFNEVLALDAAEQRVKLLESNYVVNMTNFFRPCQPQALFQFEHKSLSLSPDQRDNRRFKSLTFKSNLDYMCHGFAGYFDTVLYGCYKLSIVPDTYSKGMFSWFPIFFPLVNPISVTAGQNLTVDFWRKVSPTQVWYELSVTEPFCQAIQNPAGRSTSMGL